MNRSSHETVQRVAQDKRQLILDAATHVFAEKGYHGSRISDIRAKPVLRTDSFITISKIKKKY